MTPTSWYRSIMSKELKELRVKFPTGRVLWYLKVEQRKDYDSESDPYDPNRAPKPEDWTRRYEFVPARVFVIQVLNKNSRLKSGGSDKNEVFVRTEGHLTFSRPSDEFYETQEEALQDVKRYTKEYSIAWTKPYSDFSVKQGLRK